MDNLIWKDVSPPKYPIGLSFVRHYRKDRNPETVVDIYTTINSKGEVVKVRYVTEHMFMGQPVRDDDVVAVTIARSLVGTQVK